MRTIVKRPAPSKLIAWRQARLAKNKGPGAECSYDELRRDKAAIRAVEDRLYAEQGGICAYTGLTLGLTPGSSTSDLFLSPLTASCGQRFRFDRKGCIFPADTNDAAAKTTIEKLGLDHDTLKDLRRNAIRGALDGIMLKDARRTLKRLKTESERLDQGEDVKLDRFCFVIEQALEREIRKLEAIRSGTH